MDKHTVLSLVESYSESDPEFITSVIQASIKGLKNKAQKSYEMASDMETLAAVSFGIMADGKKVTPKTKKQFEKLALSKLEKYDFNTSCNWKWALEKKETE